MPLKPKESVIPPSNQVRFGLGPIIVLPIIVGGALALVFAPEIYGGTKKVVKGIGSIPGKVVSIPDKIRQRDDNIKKVELISQITNQEKQVFLFKEYWGHKNHFVKLAVLEEIAKFQNDPTLQGEVLRHICQNLSNNSVVMLKLGEVINNNVYKPELKEELLFLMLKASAEGKVKTDINAMTYARSMTSEDHKYELLNAFLNNKDKKVKLAALNEIGSYHYSATLQERLLEPLCQQPIKDKKFRETLQKIVTGIQNPEIRSKLSESMLEHYS